MSTDENKETKRIQDGISSVEEAIQNSEIRSSLESLLESYSKLDRVSLVAKQVYLAESITELCGVSGAELILNLLSNGANRGSLKIVDQITNPEVKAFLKKMITLHGAQYQWFLDPFAKDWQRYNISTRYLGSPLIPIVNFLIISKEGQSIEIESPLPAFFNLVSAQISHLKAIEDEMERMGTNIAVVNILGREQLIKMREVLDTLIKQSESSPAP